jgi:hypothetical protein
VFGILAATYAGGTIIYTLLGTGELQPWNGAQRKTDSEKNEEETRELQPWNGAQKKTDSDKNEVETEERVPLRNNNV